MPGEEDQPPGTQPGQAKPKILFGKNDGEQSLAPHPAPRVLFPGDAAINDQVAQPMEQTNQSTPSVLFGVPIDQVPKATGPRVIGETHQRIPCTEGALQALDASATPATVTVAMQLVEGINLDDAHFDDVVRFGADLQAEHAALTETALAIANSPTLQQGELLIREMLRILGDLNPEKVFAKPSLGMVLRELAASHVPPHLLFAEKYPQLLDLARKLSLHESALLAILEKLEALRPGYGALAQRLGAHVLAANFVVNFARSDQIKTEMRAHYASQADTLEVRVTSLLATQANLEVGKMTHEMLAQQVRTLLSGGRGMLEEDLPAFNTAYTAAIAQRNTTIELDPLRRIYAKILTTLQKGAKP